MSWILPLLVRLVPALLIAVGSVPIPASSVAATESATVFAYHRIGQDDPAGVGITTERFEEHIEELKKRRYSVLPLEEVVERLRDGTSLPDRTVAITIDDAYRSVYEIAWPKLRAAGLPFTVFVSTDPIDTGNANYMTWDQLREMKQAGVTIGAKSRGHAHLVERLRRDARASVVYGHGRLNAELGEAPRLFAYPHGEYSLMLRGIAIDVGYLAALGQHSGVIDEGTDPYALPRFTLNERYGGIDRFRLIANALPLSATDVLPVDPVLGENPPAFGFTVAEEIGGLGKLACFASNVGRVRHETLERRVEVRLDRPFPAGRSRINCTMPGPDDRWRWLGRMFVVPR